MLIKLSVTNEMLPKLQIEGDAATIWKRLKDLHDTSNKGRTFFHKNLLFSHKMDENGSLQDHLLMIKDLRDS